MMQEINVQELKQKLDASEDFILLDVRNNDEFEHVNIGGKLIPLGELPDRFDEIEKGKEIVCMCHHGGRSAKATQFLTNAGYDNVKNLVGGIHVWSLEIDSSKPTY